MTPRRSEYREGMRRWRDDRFDRVFAAVAELELPPAMLKTRQATVGALRAQSPYVETDIVSRAESTARFEANPT